MATPEPKKAREGKAWKIEHQKGNKEIVLEEDEVNQKQAIQIYKCHDSIISIKGKVNEILIDNCTKVGVLVHSAISSVDIVNSSGINVEIQGEVPAIQIDKSSGVNVFLSKTAEKASIITTNISEVNVFTYNGEDQVEHNVPHQFTSKVVNGKLITTPTQYV